MVAMNFLLKLSVIINIAQIIEEFGALEFVRYIIVYLLP